jgi:hypothetical protein
MNMTNHINTKRRIEKMAYWLPQPSNLAELPAVRFLNVAMATLDLAPRVRGAISALGLMWVHADMKDCDKWSDKPICPSEDGRADLFVVNEKKTEKRQTDSTTRHHNLYVRVRFTFSRPPTPAWRNASRRQRDIRLPECLRQLRCVLVNDGVGCSPAKQCRP